MFVIGLERSLCPLENVSRYTKPLYMNKFLAVTGLICAVLLTTCKKSDESRSDMTGVIERAKAYYQANLATVQYSGDLSNPRLKTPRTPIWEKATTITGNGGIAVVVPVLFSLPLYIHTAFEGRSYFLLDDITRLVVIITPGSTPRSFLLTYIPDTNFIKSRGRPFSGLLLAEDWSGSSLKQWWYSGDGHIYSYSSAGSGIAKASTVVTKVQTDLLAVTTCTVIEGYNYAADDPDNGEAWTETTGCSTTFIDDGGGYGGMTGSTLGGGGGGGGGAPAAPANTLVVPGPNNIITNIKDYLKCFTNGSSVDHTFSVQVCVAQPIPGSRDPWGFVDGGPYGSSSANNIVDVGHTFLILKENSAGNIITRNVGFYPSGSVSPLGPESQGVLNNDQGHSYNVSLTVTVNSTQFFAILNYVELGNNTGFDYNLNSNNCTTFALNAMSAGSVSLPSTTGSWPMGSGNDPGDLGQDIMGMKLQPNMQRNTVSSAHPNTASCSAD